VPLALDAAPEVVEGAHALLLALGDAPVAPDVAALAADDHVDGVDVAGVADLA
jgi:hypothetical protein